ncbi:MAG: hypothetical protein CL840_01475 [Crocinitomicaceae bacterium]|nr:hypothetical protein [Crocinitomicaceae bacterium]|tara:strand:+ start:2500 stop:5952 length:3453 start_codon:yes stop_codon:yes gene_type:complete
MSLLRPFFSVVLIILFTGSVFSQEDTLVVQLTTFGDGLDNRRAWRVFPPKGDSYRRILMYQTLKCDPALISNPTNSGCGEWDAGANFVLRRHINRDSLRYLVNRSYPETIKYLTLPTESYIRLQQKQIGYSSTSGETIYSVGSGSQTISNGLKTGNRSGRSQYIYKSSELTASGLTAGKIDKVKLDVSKLGSGLGSFKIRMKATTRDSISDAQFEEYNFTTIYYKNTSISSTGKHTFDLHQPFNWDGVSNVLIDFSFSNKKEGTDFELKGTQTTTNQGLYAQGDDAYMEFDGNDYIDVDNGIASTLKNELTISTWIYGDPNAPSQHKILINAIAKLDADRNKILAYVPQANGKVDWRAGYTTKLDGVNGGPVADSTVKGKWNHWAFTKNALSGEMHIYHNGVKLYSASGKTQTLEDIAVFRIGNWSQDTKDQPYYGKVNDFRVWNKELDAATIKDWMYSDVVPSHPNYQNLVAYFKMDSSSATQVFDHAKNHHGELLGIPQKHYSRGEELFRNGVKTNKRPNIEFIRGTYTSSVSTITVTDTITDEPMSIAVSKLYKDFNKEGLQDLFLDTMYVWQEGYSFTRDLQGNKLDSVYHTGSQTLVNHYDEGQFRVVKYITPYGNNLDLGEGFTWVYDVTDYEPLLHDTLDFQGGDHRELIDWKFVFIKGTPPRKVNQVEQVYGGGAQYEDIVIKPVGRNVVPDANSKMFKIRTMVTGHKFNNPTNCAEFCFRKHFVTIDGSKTTEWVNFTECSTNPLYPQGGTWIYDRAGWCPGAGASVIHSDVTNKITAGVPVLIEQGVEKDPTGTEYGSWNIECHFIGYDSPSYSLDAEMLDILSPNNWEYYGRMNPICANPVVVIRNSGSTDMTSAEIEFGTDGVGLRTIKWTGHLRFAETDTVLLPTITDVLWNAKDSIGHFVARIKSVNGSTDEHKYNDQLRTRFNKVPAYPDELIITFRTNTKEKETSWNIKDQFGKVIASSDSVLQATTVYNDTVKLDIGCYTFNVEDKDDDGLSFWNNSDGSGFILIRDLAGTFQQAFEQDFGRNIHFQFSVGALNNIGQEEIQGPRTFENKPFLQLFPNPNDGNFQIEFNGFSGEYLTLRVVNSLGKEVLVERWKNSQHFDSRNVSMRNQPTGIYKILISDGKNVFSKSLIIQE